MIACPSCGFEAPDDFAFCPKCATSLAVPLAVPEERKVVTTLFCDIVAFTAMSEAADPEDVDALLGEYFARATKVIESHGGTVEKFIGDAAVGVFGVPAVHEDDPERAVRAGLRIVEALDAMTCPDGSPLQVRVGINTGEALVRLDVDPSSGRGFLTGDAVNTAARLQSAAPRGGVAVGALTHELTERVIAYEELPRVVAKGKAKPVAAWRAIAPIARRGLDAGIAELSPLVGREKELSHLSSLFQRAVSEAAPHFVLLVGEPGIGKSRLVRELSALVDARPEMTLWRQGYCPPFGEDITYRALSEIVKGHAGILDSDEPDAAAARLDAVLPRGPDREWVRRRLRALVGLSAPEAAREENFTAWLRFFEDAAAAKPTVLVFEDLHWADEALLAFVEYLTTRIDGVPLLIVGTARPELFERHPAFAVGTDVTRIGLEPLSPGETARLVAGLLGVPEDHLRAVSEVVERCGGNPFYAEQSSRLLADTGSDVSLPDSVQAVIAARLDTLPSTQKALLCDAAVIGSVFWDGALAAIEARQASECDGDLAGLVERRLIRRIRESSMKGEREFAFVHALARDVAYRQLPRAARAHKHAAVAEWMERLAGGRAPDVAGIAAHHCTTALELARAVHDDALTATMLPAALTWLGVAADRAVHLDLAAAQTYYERALGLIGESDAAPPYLLRGYAEALELRGSVKGASQAYRQAAAAFEASGDKRAAAVVLMRLGSCLTSWGSPDAGDADSRALRLLEDDGPSTERALVLAQSASRLLAIVGDAPGAIERTDQAIAMAAELGVPAPLQAYEYRGAARCATGDSGGLADMRRASELAEAEGSALSTYYSLVNEAVMLAAFEGPGAVLPLVRTGADRAERRGAGVAALLFTTQLLEAQYLTGEWDQVVKSVDEVAAQLSEAADVSSLLSVQLQLALVRAFRGEAERARDLVTDMLALGRESTYVWYPLQAGAAVWWRLGDAQAALDCLAELPGIPSIGTDCSQTLFLPEAVRIAAAAGDMPLADALLGRIGRASPAEQRAHAMSGAQIQDARGDQADAAAAFADAAARWHDFGVPYEEAQALLGQGRCLVALGRRSKSVAPLAAAHEIFARLGAKPALAETDEWLTRTGPE